MSKPIILTTVLFAAAFGLIWVFYAPLLGIYHQVQGGRLLAQVFEAGDNEYGGFWCLRPFIEDFEQRETLRTALIHLRQAQEVAPNQSHSYYLTGKIWCLLGEYEKAVEAFDRYGKLRPKNPLGYLEMGFALLQACPPNGKCPNGLNTYDAWHKADVRPEHFLALAERARQQGDNAAALKWYQNAQRMGMQLQGTIFLVTYLASLSSDQKNLKALEQATRQDFGWATEKDRIEANYTFAVELFGNKEYDKARKYFLRTIKLVGEQEIAKISMSYLYIGLSYAYAGDLDNALPNLRKAIEVGPRNEWAHVNYGIYLYYADPSKIKGNCSGIKAC